MDVRIRERQGCQVNPVHLHCHVVFHGIGRDDDGVRRAGVDDERSRFHLLTPAGDGERHVNEMRIYRHVNCRDRVFSGPECTA